MKTTMNYKNVVIALSANTAVLLTEASYKKQQYKVFNSASARTSALQALDFMLDKVADNAEITKEIIRIYVPDMLKGFAMGTFIEYIRTNQTSSGKQFTDEEKVLVNSIANKMASKMFNFVTKESKFMPKDLAFLRSAAIDFAKAESSKAPQVTPQAQSQAPSQAKSPVLVALEEQMAKAIAEANFDLYDKLEERYNKMLGANAAPQAPVVEEEPVEEEVYDDLEDNEVEVDEDIANMDC